MKIILIPENEEEKKIVAGKEKTFTSVEQFLLIGRQTNKLDDFSYWNGSLKYLMCESFFALETLKKAYHNDSSQ